MNDEKKKSMQLLKESFHSKITNSLTHERDGMFFFSGSLPESPVFYTAKLNSLCPSLT